jgi:hypothetical protein
MCRTGELVLTQRFKSPDAACDPRTYRDYVTRVCAHDVTMDELQELCALFVCGVDEIVAKIVSRKMGERIKKGKG